MVGVVEETKNNVSIIQVIGTEQLVSYRKKMTFCAKQEDIASTSETLDLLTRLK